MGVMKKEKQFFSMKELSEFQTLRKEDLDKEEFLENKKLKELELKRVRNFAINYIPLGLTRRDCLSLNSLETTTS